MRRKCFLYSSGGHATSCRAPHSLQRDGSTVVSLPSSGIPQDFKRGLNPQELLFGLCVIGIQIRVIRTHQPTVRSLNLFRRGAAMDTQGCVVILAHRRIDAIEAAGAAYEAKIDGESSTVPLPMQSVDVRSSRVRENLADQRGRVTRHTPSARISAQFRRSVPTPAANHSILSYVR